MRRALSRGEHAATLATSSIVQNRPGGGVDEVCGRRRAPELVAEVLWLDPLDLAVAFDDDG
jgi:hypothetical protein